MAWCVWRTNHDPICGFFFIGETLAKTGKQKLQVLQEIRSALKWREAAGFASGKYHAGAAKEAV
jgi:hypothetical protein